MWFCSKGNDVAPGRWILTRGLNINIWHNKYTEMPKSLRKMVTLITSVALWVTKGFSTLTLLAFGAQSCSLGGGRLVHCGTFSSIHGLSRLDASGILPPVHNNQTSPDITIYSFDSKINPSWEPQGLLKKWWYWWVGKIWDFDMYRIY